MLNGILNINKLEGITSFEVVKNLKRISGIKKIGHTGTLDPFATGVLVVCFGEATKIVSYLMDSDKEYEATMFLGKTTDTQDKTGKVLSNVEVENFDITKEMLDIVLKNFIGEIEQIPPMFSAISYKGQRLYKLARKGIEIERQARKINIKKIEILECNSSKIKLIVECGKGTYIRTLCHDIGEKLGCGAYLEKLTRTMSGKFNVKDAVNFSEIRNTDDIEKKMFSIENALSDLKSITMKPGQEKLVRFGVPITPINIEENISDIGDEIVAIFSSQRELLAVGEKSRYNPNVIIKRGFNL